MRVGKFLVSYIFYGGLAAYFFAGYTYGGQYAEAHLLSCILFVFLGIWNSILADQT